jgi:hypothetical protein
MVSVISTALLTALAKLLTNIIKVRPPKEGAPSYALWNAETDEIRKMLSTQSENIAQDSSELE